MTSKDNNQIFFAEEKTPLWNSDTPQNSTASHNYWKIMVVDDDKEVHTITELVLKNFSFDNKGLVFLHAYDGKEARELIRKHPDTAVLFLDVVMETSSSGLEVVKYIRRELENNFVRIILRTGQPGQAPEEKVIVEYDINDYKEKTEFSSQKLFTCMVTSLRSYRDILTIEANRLGLKRIIDASASLFEIRSIKQLASGVLTQLVSILHMEPNAIVCDTSGFAASKTNGNLEVLAATGKFESIKNRCSKEDLPASIIQDMEEAVREKKCLYYDDRYIGYFKSDVGSEILIYCEGWQELTELNKKLIEIFCTNVHIAFENTYLNKEIEETQKEIIYTLGEVAEARSKETGFHVKRVSEYCRLLGEKCGLPPRQIEILRMASPMHDVGKVAIPDTVLNFPGPLTEQDFEVMKNHAEIGSDMLAASTRTIMKAASIIAVEHHEKWDGTGYPKSLKGEEIHIFARITSIADVFDALCNDRIYRKAYDMDTVLEYLAAQRGKHFDPKLVDIFLGNIDEFLQIRATFMSEEMIE
ncbi:MAG: DUF3369 domain-containing protein [Desulfobulbaceae bacterium]|nr:DUF3369 domain-containing protein [Desulfobulbaceae bacterium]